jgi:hypothetical protein
MTKISASPDRHFFQKEGYIKRMEEKDESPNEDYLDWFQTVLEGHWNRFDDPASQENNLEYDLLTTEWILDKVRASDAYAQNLYASMCNMQWQKREVMPILKDQYWGCSWRYAGGIIADMQQKGDYIDWYCSGMGDGLGNGDADGVKGYVPEGTVTEEIADDLYKLGWVCKEDNGDQHG